MGAEIRMEAAPVTLARLVAALDEDAGSFEFMQAVRLLERFSQGRAGPGLFVDPANEAVRFSAHMSIAFPTSEIQQLAAGDGAEPRRMTVNVFGLTGPSGVLPYEYTLLAAERHRARDGGMAAFLDLFNHRAVSLLYRAWRRHRLAVLREQGEADPVSGHLLDLLGAGLPAMRGRTALPDDTLAHLAGVLGPRPRSAVALEQAIEAVFAVPAEVEQFVGAWYPVAAADRCSLGDEDGAAPLGSGALAGDEVWDAHAGARIRLGPMRRAEYDAFLPSGRHHEALRALTRYFADDQYTFELLLVLDPDEVPGCVVGEDEAGERLGWSTWIRTEPFRNDLANTMLAL
jgi:type VI secretion system protein ImpH